MNNIIFMFYTESEAFGGSLSVAYAVPMLDQFIKMYGGKMAGIHPVDADYSANVANTYSTLEDAQAAYPRHEWMYMDATGTRFLDEYVHPADNVVYVAGHDRFGYGRSDLSNGVKIKLRTIQSDFDGHALPTLITVACDRWART